MLALKTMKNPAREEEGMEHIAACYEASRAGPKSSLTKFSSAAWTATDGHQGVSKPCEAQGLEAAPVW